MASRARRRLHFLLGFGAFFIALWFLWSTPAVYPLKIFVVLLHEVSHAAVAVATGGSVERIVLNPQQGGACYCPGGNAFLTLSAGYLGSLGWGALMFGAARTRRARTEWLMGLIGGLVVLLTVFFVRSAFGIAFGIAFGLAMVMASRYLGAELNRMFLASLGLTSALYAILDIKSDILDRPDLQSDARMLAEITGIPTLAWGVIWIAVAVAGATWMLHRAYRHA
jgi:hypothetical protein